MHQKIIDVHQKIIDDPQVWCYPKNGDYAQQRAWEPGEYSRKTESLWWRPGTQKESTNMVDKESLMEYFGSGNSDDEGVDNFHL